MKAIILCAGEGTRLRPLTLDRPKPMLLIGEKPLLEHLILWLRGHGITRMAMNLHHKPHTVLEYFGDGARWGVEITYSLEDSILGTAGAVKKLQSYVDGTFAVVYGDLLTNLDITSLARYHRAKGGMATVALYRVDNPSACGLVELDSAGRILRFVEKPPPDEVFTELASTGVFVLEPEILEYVPPHIFYDFGHDLFPRLLREAVPMYGYPIAQDEYLIDIGTPEKYQRAQREWARVCHPDSMADSRIARAPGPGTNRPRTST